MIPTTLQNISTGLGMIGEELDLAWEQDPFMRVFPTFLAEAKKEVSCLKEPVLTYQNNYLTLLRIFGEDPKTPIVDFFKVLHRFLAAFQVNAQLCPSSSCGLTIIVLSSEMPRGDPSEEGEAAAGAH